jgi:SulP family sulfate permease
MNEIFKPKLFSVFKHGISKSQLTKDVFAGVIVGIVALPLSIAFAVASGVSPDKGLATAIIAGFLISALGGSRVQIGGPTGAFIVIVYSIVSQYGLDGLLISSMMAGVMLIAFGLMRLGSLLKFFPHPLVVGFTSGIAVVIFST